MTTEQDLAAVERRNEQNHGAATLTLRKAITVGILGRLTGTLAMDVVMVAES